MKNYKMKLFSSIILCLALLLVGCGAKSSAPPKPNGLINGFENLQSDTQIGDFNLETQGYVNLEQFKKFNTQGKYSCKAIFSVPADFLSAVEAAKVPSWITEINMSIKTLTPIKITDWSVFKKFDVDVYTPDKITRNFYVKVTDVNGKEFISQQQIKPGKTKVDILVDDIKTSRIDTTNITGISLYIDTKGEPKDVILYLDNIRLTP